jgi:CNT family concentrative nucleoside transporter
MSRLTGLIGVVVLLGIAMAVSTDRRRISWRVLLWGLGLQLVFALLILRTVPGEFVFRQASAAFQTLIGFADKGSSFLFGDLATSVMAFRVLPIIIFFASLMAVLYHLGLMQKLVSGMARLMRWTMGVSGAEALSAAGNVFVGMTEAPLLVRPYVAGLTDSELLAVMTGGLATIAGSVMAAYVSFGVDAGHLLCASVMSAPAALVMAKVILPETGEPETAGTTRVVFERKTRNVIDAAAVGASDGLRLALNVGAMLIAFLALLAIVDFLFAQAHLGCQQLLGWQGFPGSLADLFAIVFRPVAWAIGVPWDEAGTVGSLMGLKISANEWIAYGRLVEVKSQLSPRSVTIATYALCGFSNFGSIAIMIGGISGLSPERRPDLSRLAVRALIGGTLASFLTACLAGMLV